MLSYAERRGYLPSMVYHHAFEFLHCGVLQWSDDTGKRRCGAHPALVHDPVFEVCGIHGILEHVDAGYAVRLLSCLLGIDYASGIQA